MAKGKFVKEEKRRRVSFSYESTEAKEVILMGDFNNWNSKAHPMKHDRKGLWKISLMLAPETYEYRFLVDGEWKNDPNQESCPNPFGTVNNYIVVVPHTKNNRGVS
ncbi:MAG: glycogen-binding domain-containing protein [Desulfobacterales bacterium]|nr:glycogen-binding domain-containing protein [Desulfobacterales bacterium]